MVLCLILLSILLSRPARGGWIEIILNAVKSELVSSRPARGGWIEISIKIHDFSGKCSPAPHGAGGLKSDAPISVSSTSDVPPRTGRVD